MKYIKEFKEYGKEEDIDVILQNIKDIFQEFTDSGMEVTVRQNQKVSTMMRFTGKILGAGVFPDIFTGVKTRRPQPYNYFSYSIEHLVSYMQSCGYEICGFSLYHLYHGSYVCSGIWKDKKPFSVHIKTDPLTHCEQKYNNTLVKDVEISFSKIKN